MKLALMRKFGPPTQLLNIYFIYSSKFQKFNNFLHFICQCFNLGFAVCLEGNFVEQVLFSSSAVFCIAAMVFILRKTYYILQV